VKEVKVLTKRLLDINAEIVLNLETE